MADGPNAQFEIAGVDRDDAVAAVRPNRVAGGLEYCTGRTTVELRGMVERCWRGEWGLSHADAASSAGLHSTCPQVRGVGRRPYERFLSRAISRPGSSVDGVRDGGRREAAQPKASVSATTLAHRLLSRSGQGVVGVGPVRRQSIASPNAVSPGPKPEPRPGLLYFC